MSGRKWVMPMPRFPTPGPVLMAGRMFAAYGAALAPSCSQLLEPGRPSTTTCRAKPGPEAALLPGGC